MPDPVVIGVRRFEHCRKNKGKSPDDVKKNLRIVLSRNYPGPIVDQVVSGVDQFAEISVSSGKSNRRAGTIYSLVLKKNWEPKLRGIVARA